MSLVLVAMLVDVCLLKNYCCYAVLIQEATKHATRIINRDNVVGCCDDFDERIEVTADIRSESSSVLLDLQAVQERFVRLDTNYSHKHMQIYF